MLATSEGGLTSSWLAVHLLELKALVAVAIALGVAKVIAGRGPATLFGGLFGRGLAPVGTRAHMQAEVLALHAELLTAAGQDVLAGGPGTLGPGGTLCGSRHVSVLARSLRGKSRGNCGSYVLGVPPCHPTGQCGCYRELCGVKSTCLAAGTEFHV